MHVFLAIFTLFFAPTPTAPEHFQVIVGQVASEAECNDGAPDEAAKLAATHGAQTADWVCVTFVNHADKPV